MRKKKEIKIGLKNEKNPRWKGEKASYFAIHIWLNNHFGSPKKCKKCGTTEAKRYEWANISGKYTRKRKDYKRLCVSCHRKFDKNIWLPGENHINHKLKTKEVLLIRKLYNPVIVSHSILAKKFNVSKSTIKDIIKRRTWKHLARNMDDVYCIIDEKGGFGEFCTTNT